MKKVVLLAGAIAAGMAVAPQTANAANPASPKVDEVKAIDMTNSEVEAVLVEAKILQKKYHDLMSHSRFTDPSVVSADLQAKIQKAYEHVSYLIAEGEKIIDGDVDVNLYFNSTGTNQGTFKIDPTKNVTNINPLVIPAINVATPEWVKEYTGLTKSSTIKDLFEKQKDAFNPILVSVTTKLAASTPLPLTPEQIKEKNAAAAATVNHDNLDKILEEALDILGAYDENYQEPAGDKSNIYDAEIYGGKDGAINTKFDATVKGHIEAAKQLLDKIAKAGDVDNELISAFELQTDVNVLTPLLEGYVITFKIEANHVAADNLKDELTSEFGTLKHHEACGHKDTHKVAEEIQKTIDQLDPDADWDAEMDLHVRANSNPKAVLAWEDFLNGTSCTEVTTLYKKALGWDVVDLKDAIDAFKTRYAALEDCDVKKDINTFLFTGTTKAGTIAKEYADLEKDIKALGTTVTPAQFAALDQRVTDLFKRIANVEKAWEDLAKLNKDDFDLQKEITDAKDKDGYSSTTIKKEWEGKEQVELNNLEADIHNELLKITKDKEFVGYNHFKPTVDLEKDHHKWLAAYQKANYDAFVTMQNALKERRAEATNVENSKLDASKKETTTKNDGLAFKLITGEKNPLKFIYWDKYFTEIEKHFSITPGKPGGSEENGHADDLQDDRINKWYHDAEAEYIGAKTYAAGWENAAHDGQLKTNTGKGVESVLTTNAVEKADVVFGWLQKEIQAAYQGIVENEAANRKLHDQIDDCQDYVNAAQKDIDANAVVVLKRGEFTVQEHNIETRLSEDKTFASIDITHDIKYKGDDAAGNFAPAELPELYKGESLSTLVLPATPDYYNGDSFNCGHETGVLTWTKIATEITALWNKEKEEYDKVASKALLDSKYVENKITVLEENVDDIKNEAYTQVIKNGFAEVQKAINDARKWAYALDKVCDTEDVNKPCSEDDVNNNPCGWDDPKASKALAELVDFYNKKLALLGTEHNGEANDDHATPVVDEDNIKEFADYLNQMLADLKAWQVKFAAADKAHKIKLIAAIDMAEDEIHTVHHFAEDAKHDLAAFTDEDKAAADVWATTIFNAAPFVQYEGKDYTFFEFVKLLDTKASGAAFDVDHNEEPDYYAFLKELVGRGEKGQLNNFEEYIKALSLLPVILQEQADFAFDHHLYTELQRIADAAKNLNVASDYMKKVEANKDTHAEYVETLGNLQTEVNAIEISATEVYGEEYTGEVANTKYSELYGLRGDINDAIDTLLGTVNTEYAEGKCDAYAFDATPITTKITELKNALEAAKKLYAEEHALYSEYSEKVNNLETLRDALTTTVWAVYDDIDLDKDGAALNVEIQAINNAILNERQALQSDVNAGTVKAHAEAHDNAVDAIESAIQTLEEHIAAYEKFYADEHALAADYDKQVADLEVLQQSLDTTWAVYDDIDNDKDAAALSAAYQAIREAIAAERAAIATDLEAGHVQAHAADYEEAGETVKGHDTAIGDINDAIKTLQDNVKLFEKFYADEHALADKYNDELNNLETLRDALGTVWDAYETLDDSDKTLTALHADWQAITEDIAAERTAIADDLEAGHVQANATDHEDALSNIADAIKNLQDKVRDIEQFKAENKDKAAELTNDLTNLLAVLEGLHKYGDVYPEDKAVIDYLLDNADITAEVPAGVKAAVLGLVERVQNEVANVADDLENGRVVDNYENYKAAIDYFKADIEDLKQVIAEAETLYAENLRALNNLEEHYRAVLSDLNEEEGNSKCELCDKEDDDTRDKLISDLNDIFDDFTSNFNVEKNLNQIEVYADFEKQLNDIEAGVKELKKSHEDHYDLVKTSQKAADNILDKLFDFNELFWGLEATPGYENFKERTDHCSNPDVLYVNELKGELQNLKETVEYDNSHEGGHAAFENYNVYLKWIAQLKTSIEKTKAAIQANEAAKVILDAQFEEVAGLVNDALVFWEDNYMDETLVQLEEIVAYWTGTPAGEKGKVQEMYDLIQDKYQHGAAAYDWTVDAKGEEFKQAVIDDVEKQKQDIEMHRNTAANYEAINHMDEVQATMDALVAAVKADVTEGDKVDPFVKELYADFVALVGEYAVDSEGLYGVLAQIDANRNEHFQAGDLEAALNIDEASKIKGIHQMLNELKANAETLVATYNDLFENAHHLTNGKTLYSDMEYVTIGFFRHANEGLGEQATEMFKEVELHFNAEDGNIGIFDTTWLNVLDWEDVNNTPDNWFDDVPAAYERDFAGHLVHQEGLGVIPAQIGILGHGDKKNELTFTLNDEKGYEVVTLAAGPADITFQPGSLTVDGWTTKHNVYIEVNVAAPEVESNTPDVMTGSNKLIVRLENPIDLTYTNNSLIARTNDGTEISYADRVINYAAKQLEFNLPEGTTSIELPEGFFTFRTGENTIARSAAMVIAVGNTTTIEGLIAMGEKAQIFDLQGRRVKAEALISGNTYVVNGEKVMVK